jgi:hypothetical protein
MDTEAMEHIGEVQDLEHTLKVQIPITDKLKEPLV